MGVKSMIVAIIKTLKMARKSDREEFMLYLKLVLLGLAVVGTIGFIIQLVASLIRIAGGG
jgi:protein transport protein SEC61 subunit gamma-like protein